MDMGENEADPAPRKGHWLKDTLGQVKFVAMLRERYRIRRVCVESLRLYRKVEADMPDSTKTERYVRIIQKRGGGDRSAAIRIMRLAEESFAAWPNERPLNFRDIVGYIAVTDNFKKDIALTGVRSRVVDYVFDIVAELIPANL